MIIISDSRNIQLVEKLFFYHLGDRNETLDKLFCNLQKKKKNIKIKIEQVKIVCSVSFISLLCIPWNSKHTQCTRQSYDVYDMNAHSIGEFSFKIIINSNNKFPLKFNL